MHTHVYPFNSFLARAGTRKAEASIEKYQRRIEELNAFKKQNKELELKMEEYLDKIHDLESGNKSIATLTKKIGRVYSVIY